MENQIKLKKAVVYVRCCSNENWENELFNQMQACREYACKNNITIVGDYADIGKAGTNANRPAFQKMIKDSYKKVFDIILISSYERFSRNRFDYVYYESRLHDKNVEILIANDNNNSIDRFLIEYINAYSAMISKKFKRGLKAKKGGK